MANLNKNDKKVLRAIKGLIRQLSKIEESNQSKKEENTLKKEYYGDNVIIDDGSFEDFLHSRAKRDENDKESNP